MRAAVSDSSPLIHLAAIGRLELLHSFHEAVLIPDAVWREVVTQGGDRPGVREVLHAQNAGWLKMETATPNPTLAFLRNQLDAGESEAIALALEKRPDVLLLDEGFGRAVARRFGVKVIGSIGILIRAKREGLLLELRPELERLRGPGRFYLSQSLYEAALRDVGE